VADHTDFWVAVATISPIAIATNLLTFGQVIVRKSALRRAPDEPRKFTAFLRSWHLFWVALNLAACLALIAMALMSLWSRDDFVSGWVAGVLLLGMLVELCILPVCTESILNRAKRQEAEARQGAADRPSW
jgi:cell division protein FtsW (lipid II flippase)